MKPVLRGDVSLDYIADYRKAMRLVDETGTSVPFHVEEYYGTMSHDVEMQGAQAETPVEFLNSRRGFQETNLLEAGTGEGERQTLRARPYEIKTVRLRIPPPAETH